MTIRQYAKIRGHKIVGKLIRYSVWDGLYGMGSKCYIDIAGNEYYINKHGCCIVTANGDVI